MKKYKSRKDCGLLTGNTGLGRGGFHISANYSCNGLVFVEWKSRKWGDVWKRMRPDRAKKEGREVILCSHKGCKRPAAQLDHLWPYYSEGTLCERHSP